jgi:hypothetical protein
MISSFSGLAVGSEGVDAMRNKEIWFYLVGACLFLVFLFFYFHLFAGDHSSEDLRIRQQREQCLSYQGSRDDDARRRCQDMMEHGIF